MTTQLTSTGFQRDGLDVTLAALQAAAQTIFGTDINVDSDSPDGQLLGVFAGAKSDLDQLLESIYNNFNPNNATGLGLSRLVQLNGIKRIAGAYSVDNVTFSGIENTVISSGFLIANPDTQYQFETQADATIDSTGTVTVAVKCTVMGDVSIAAGTITKLVNAQYGVTSVTNLGTGSAGRAEETDAELRIRRLKCVAVASQGLADSVLAGLLNDSNVTLATVVENRTDSEDANGLPPHSICAVVLGDTDDNVAQIIWDTISCGCTWYGNTTGTATDIKSHDHTVAFSRPVKVPIYVEMTIAKRTGYPNTAVSDIQTAMVDWGASNQDIGEEVIYSRLYEPINSIAGFAVTSLKIGTSATSLVQTNLELAYDELAVFSAANITITVTG